MGLFSFFRKPRPAEAANSLNTELASIPLVAEYAGKTIQARIEQRREFKVGRKVVVESKSGHGKLAIVFEDDGDTGYIYVCDFGNAGKPILDAMHLYNADAVANRDVPLDLKLCWSVDRQKAICLIDNFPHAAVDFTLKRAYCRNNFPPLHGAWAEVHADHAWDDTILDVFV